MGALRFFRSVGSLTAEETGSSDRPTAPPRPNKGLRTYPKLPPPRSLPLTPPPDPLSLVVFIYLFTLYFFFLFFFCRGFFFGLRAKEFCGLVLVFLCRCCFLPISQLQLRQVSATEPCAPPPPPPPPVSNRSGGR